MNYNITFIELHASFNDIIILKGIAKRWNQLYDYYTSYTERYNKALVFIANSLSLNKDQYIKFYEAEHVDSDEPMSEQLFNDSDDDLQDISNDESAMSLDKRQNDSPYPSEDSRKPKPGNARINSSQQILKSDIKLQKDDLRFMKRIDIKSEKSELNINSKSKRKRFNKKLACGFELAER